MLMSRRRLMGLAAGGPLLAAAGGWSAGASRSPVILDTDIGTDIDDALTVAYLLAQKRCELLGVTTVYGDTVSRARLVSAICQAAGRAVPIHAGSSRLIRGPGVKGKVPQAEVLSRWPHEKDFTPGSAVEFLYRTLRSRPGEVTLLAVGPLTNVAGLFRHYPDAPSLLKRLTIMNGSFRIMHREYNVAGDPEASRLVYETAVPELVAVDFDTSLRCWMSRAETRRRIKGGALDPVADMAEVWFRTLPIVIFYDSLAASTIFEPEIVRFRRARVICRAGFTMIEPGSRGPHLISTGVDAEAFKEHYFQTVSALPAKPASPPL